MITRREAVRLLGSASAGVWLLAHGNAFAQKTSDASSPPLLPGGSKSPERLAVIDAFKKQSKGLEQKYEARTYKGDWVTTI